MNTSESIASIAKALAAFQAEVKQPSKSATNPHFKSKYVPLDNVVGVIHTYASKHGLSYTQMPITTEQGVGVITIIMHESGEHIEFPPFTLPLDKKTPQGAGSALTYARRYALSSAFGIASDEDDDGNGAEPQKKQSSHAQKAPANASDELMNTVNNLVVIVAQKANKSTDEVATAFGVKPGMMATDAQTALTKLKAQADKLGGN